MKYINHIVDPYEQDVPPQGAVLQCRAGCGGVALPSDSLVDRELARRKLDRLAPQKPDERVRHIG